jgi:hypothetical protein
MRPLKRQLIYCTLVESGSILEKTPMPSEVVLASRHFSSNGRFGEGDIRLFFRAPVISAQSGSLHFAIK